MQNQNRIEFANTLRGFAAISVLIAHYYGVFWMAREMAAKLTNTAVLSLESYAMPKYILGLHQLDPFFQWGPFGVALFFLISGFVIPFSLSKSSWVGFAANRIFRILPTYMAGFSICLLAIWIGGEYFSRPWPFSLKHILVHYIPGLRPITSFPGIDGVVWTLEIEVVFYFICAFVITGFRSQSRRVFLLPALIFAIGISVLMLKTIGFPQFSRRIGAFLMMSPFLIFMFIGVVFHYLYKNLIEKEKGFLMILGLFACFSISCWYYAYPGAMFVTVWSYGMALLTFTFAYVYPQFFKSNPVFNFLANISYPLYAVHNVAGFLALRILMDWGVNAWLSLGIVTASAIFVAWIIHRLIEKPFQVSSSKFPIRKEVSILPVSS